MRKRNVIALLSIVTALLMTGCSSDSTEQTGTADTTTTTASSEETGSQTEGSEAQEDNTVVSTKSGTVK